MIDVGSNVGTYSITSVSAGATKVFSLEPGPLYSRLCKNIAFNNLKEIILPFNIGLASKKGQMKWFEEKNNLGNAHLIDSIEELNFSKI